MVAKILKKKLAVCAAAFFSCGALLCVEIHFLTVLRGPDYCGNKARSNEITAAQPPNKKKKEVAKVSCRAAVKRPDTKKA